MCVDRVLCAPGVRRLGTGAAGVPPWTRWASMRSCFAMLAWASYAMPPRQ